MIERMTRDLVRATLMLLLLAPIGCSTDEGDRLLDEELSGGAGVDEPERSGDGITRILLTNDDGIAAPGLQALYTAIRAIPNTEVIVVAPATNQSGTGSGITTASPMTVNPSAPLLNGVDTGIALGGRPADTVLFALQRVYTDETPPDLVISGCNSGQNPGLAFGSGTVGAAQTASLNGVPSIACSLGITFIPPAIFGVNLADYTAAADIIGQLVDRVIRRDKSVRRLTRVLDRNEMLNINVPPRDIQGIRVTRPGTFDLVIDYIDVGDGSVRPQVDFGPLETFNPDALAQGLETDVGSLAAGFVAIAPWRNAGVGSNDGLGECCSAVDIP